MCVGEEGWLQGRAEAQDVGSQLPVSKGMGTYKHPSPQTEKKQLIRG